MEAQMSIGRLNIFFCLCLLTSGLWGQQALQLGLGLNSFSYLGDLTFDGGARRFHPGVDISLQAANSKAFRIQTRFGFGKFVEQLDNGFFQSEDDILPNSFVETDILYVDLNFTYHFFKRKVIQPFVSAGLGLLFFTPKDQLGNPLGENIFTRRAEEVYGSNTLSFPLYGGLEFKLNQTIQLEIAYLYRLSLTDYLDNIGELGTHVGNDAIQGLRLGFYFNLLGDKKKRLNQPPPIRPIQHIYTQGNLPGYVEEAWAAREELSIRMQDFVYYKVKAGDQLEQIIQRYHLSPSKVRRINFLIDDTLNPGMLLRLPNMGITMKSLTSDSGDQQK